MGLGALLKPNPCWDGMEHSIKRMTEDPQPTEKLHRNWSASFNLR